MFKIVLSSCLLQSIKQMKAIKTFLMVFKKSKATINNNELRKFNNNYEKFKKV